MCQVFILEAWVRTPNIPRGIYNVQTGHGVRFFLAALKPPTVSHYSGNFLPMCGSNDLCNRSLHSQLYHYIDSNVSVSSDRHYLDTKKRNLGLVSFTLVLFWAFKVIVISFNVCLICSFLLLLSLERNSFVSTCNFQTTLNYHHKPPLATWINNYFKLATN